MNEETEMTTGESTGETKSNKYLLSNESFELLRLSQSRIREATDMMPSLRKMINELVNQEAVELLTQRFIEKLK